MVDSGATYNTMHLSIMKAIGLDCTKYHGVGENIYAIYSRKFLENRETEDFYAWISSTPHATIGFTIILVDLPATYEVF